MQVAQIVFVFALDLLSDIRLQKNLVDIAWVLIHLEQHFVVMVQELVWAENDLEFIYFLR